MSIPLISGLGFTAVDSAGTLNDKAGTSKSKLPIQFFKLTDNISGNLILNNDSAHKKIILDTNGKTIINSAGAPLTTNSDVTLELKGSGNVQSSLKTSNSAESSTSNTGTSTFSNTDSSDVVVSNVDTDNTVEKYIDHQSGGFTYNGATIDSQGTTTVGGSTPNASTIFGTGSSYFNTTGGTPFFIGDTATSSGSPVGSGYQLSIASIPANTVSQLRMDEYANIGIFSYPNLGFGGVCSGHNRYSRNQPNKHQLDPISGFGGAARRLWWRFVRTGNNRTFVFTNNLAISCVLSGADPFDGVTVSAGATATATLTDSTDGSFNITATISGNNGSSQPFALVPPNDGTGSINTDAYTGTLSASAL